MDFVIQHWKILAFAAVLIGGFIVFVWGAASAFPSSATVAAWSVQEAIFYGCCVIAFATFLSR